MSTPQQPPQQPGRAASPGPQVAEKHDAAQRQAMGAGNPNDGNMTLFRSASFLVRAIYNPSQQKKHPLHKPTGRTAPLEESIIGQFRWLSAEKLRVTETETRLLPRTDVINPLLQKEIPIPAVVEALVIVLALLISLSIRAFNLFAYPFYGRDEGNVLANAWAVLHGALQAYPPYNYSQPPLGWAQIATWVKLIGGFFVFGNAMNTGRVFMLILSLGSSLLVYLITNRLSGSRSAGILALIIFSLSPLSITYQRLVTLENIATFWMLLSLFLIVIGDSRMPYIVGAAVALGIAILSQEAFLVFLPAMIYAVALHATTFQRKFALVAFVYITVSLVSMFVLYALLRGELFPSGTLLGGNTPHPSLIEAFTKSTSVASTDATLSSSWAIWKSTDFPLIAVTVVALVINTLGSFRGRLQWLPVLLTVSYVILLLFSNAVHDYAIIPLLPLMAINVAMALNAPMRWVTRRVGFDLLRSFLIFCLVGALVVANVQRALPILSQQPAASQTQAIQWVRANVPQNAFVVINSYLYTDLHEANDDAGGQVYPQAQIYLNVANDPAIHGHLLQAQTRCQGIDYIVADPAMLHDIQTLGGPMLLIDQALHQSILRATFHGDGSGTHDIMIYQVIHDHSQCA